MSSVTDELLRRTLRELQQLNRTLITTTRSVRNGPGKQDEQSIEDKDDTHAEAGTRPPGHLLAPEQGPRPDHQADAAAKWYYTFAGWKSRLEAAAFIFAIGYAIITYFQWRDAAKVLRISKSEFALDQRPYIVTSGPSFWDITTGKQISAPIIGQPILVTISYKNVGKSPALNMSISRFVVFGRDAYSEFIKKRPYPGIGKSGVAFPNDPTPLSTSAVSINDADINQTLRATRQEQIPWDGSKPIIVFGWIAYEDAFRFKYCTQIATIWIGGNSWADERRDDTHCKDEVPNLK